MRLVKSQTRMRYFLTFENNYRVYWAWTKYRIRAPIGRYPGLTISQSPPASDWLLVAAAWSDNTGVFDVCRSVIMMQSWWSREESWRLWWRDWVVCGSLAGPWWWPRVMGTSVSPLAQSASLYLPSLLIIQATGWPQHAGRRHWQLMITNNKQHRSCNIDVFLLQNIYCDTVTVWQHN